MADELGLRLYGWFKDASDCREENWMPEAEEMFALVSGDAWTAEEKGYLEENFRSAINFNRAGVVVDAIVGQQIGNRQEIKYLPVTQGDVDVNDLLTAVVKWVDERSDADTEVSQSFRDCAICGMGWCEVFMDYETDLDGRIQSASRFSPFDAYWDPSSEKKNLSDSRYRMRGRFWPMGEAKEKWPKLEELTIDDFSTLGIRWHRRQSPRQGINRRNQRDYNNSSDSVSLRDSDEVYVVQCQYYDLVTVYRVQNPENGQLMEMELDSEKRKVLDTLQIPYVKQRKRQYRQAYFIGTHVLDDQVSPFENGFTLLCMTDKWDSAKSMWYGIVRGMRDPQKWSNKFFADILEIMANNRKGGAFIEESAVDNPRDAERDWNSPNGLIWLKEGALMRGAVKERDPFPYPAGLDRMMQFAISSIPDTSGVNLEMMGLVDKDQAGILEAQRKQAGLAILADLFDALRQMQKDRGRVLEYMVRNYISDGRLARIVENDGSERYIPIMKMPDTIKYDVIVDESPDSPNMRDKTFAALMQVVPMMMQAGIPVPPQVMDYLPVPRSLIQQWKEFIMQNQQQRQDPVREAQSQKLLAETKKIGVETQKVGAEIGKVHAETRKIGVEAETKPYQVANDLLS